MADSGITLRRDAAALVMAVNSAALGILAGSNGHVEWSISIGYGPAALAVIGLLLRRVAPAISTALIVVAALASAVWFWLIYPVVLSLVVIGVELSRPRGPITMGTARPSA